MADSSASQDNTVSTSDTAAPGSSELNVSSSNAAACDSTVSGCNSTAASCDSTASACDSTAAACDSTAAACDSTAAACDSTTTGATATPDALLHQEDEEEEEEDEDESALESLLFYMKDKLKIGNKQADKTSVLPVLSSPTVDGVVEYIKSGRCKNIITMAGAGISTSAGIPDFRSEGSGLYDNLQKYDLPHPQAIFELGFFRQNPQPFFTLAKELYPGTFNPTISHYFIKLLEKKGLLMRHFTQNIDTLEHVAGITDDKLVEAHGSFRTAHCIDCRKLYTQQWVKEEVFADRVPTCESCNGVVKPDIVFFGEGLPKKFFQAMSTDFPVCDLLIIMGTSLTVQPFASLIDNVPATCPRLLLNREAVGQDNSVLSTMQQMIGMSSGLRLNCPKNKRDVSLLADCDDACNTLAQKLGWKEELEELIKDSRSKLSDSK